MHPLLEKSHRCQTISIFDSRKKCTWFSFKGHNAVTRVSWPDYKSGTANKILDSIEMPQIVSRKSQDTTWSLWPMSQTGRVWAGIASPTCSCSFYIRDTLFFTSFPVYNGGRGAISCMMINLDARGRDLDGPGFSSSSISVCVYREWSLPGVCCHSLQPNSNERCP